MLAIDLKTVADSAGLLPKHPRTCGAPNLDLVIHGETPSINIPVSHVAVTKALRPGRAQPFNAQIDQPDINPSVLHGLDGVCDLQRACVRELRCIQLSPCRSDPADSRPFKLSAEQRRKACPTSCRAFRFNPRPSSGARASESAGDLRGRLLANSRLRLARSE